MHGGGATPRAYLPDLHALFVGNGVAVLAYDKRGVGQSGGDLLGERADEFTIDTLARDAQAASRFLTSLPEIDRARVGLAGHSQAGWIMPLAASRESAVRFLVDFAGPAVTQGETDLYDDLTGGGNAVPQLTPTEIDNEVLARGPSGVDPIPWLRALRIPSFFAYGELDPQVPTRLSVQRLQPVAAEAGRDFTDRGLFEGEPCACRDPEWPHDGDARVEHLRSRSLPGRPGLAACTGPRALR